MYRRDLKTSAREMKRILKQSLKTGDFRGLNQEVGSVVNDAVEAALEEVRRAVGSIQGNNTDYRQGPPPWYGPGQWEEPGRQGAPGADKSTSGFGQNKSAYEQKADDWARKETQQAPKSRTPEKRAKTAPKPTGTKVAFPHEPVGKAAGVLLTVFGSIGIGGLGTAILVLTVIGLSVGNAALHTPFIAGMLPFLAASVLMQARGAAIRQRIKRYKRYLSIIGGRTNCAIKELADYSGLKERYILKDMRRMISIGMFPQGMIDSSRSRLFLTMDGYSEFSAKQTQEQPKKSEEPAQEREKEKHFNSKAEQETYETVEAGKAYVHQINDARIKLADPETAGKLLHMEAVVSKIIEYIMNHPDQRGEVRKFIEYYLPTTIKLINAYLEFEHQPVQGENITTAKKEIKVTLDTINNAFENLLDGLFKDVAWDISSDISVLETMLAQEGLTERIFNSNKK